MEVETEIFSISKLETHGLGSKAVLPFTPFALLKGFAAMRRKLSVLVISALFLAVADVSTASTPIAIGSSCSKLQATSKIHGVDAMCTKLGRAQTAIHRALRVPDGS